MSKAGNRFLCEYYAQEIDIFIKSVFMLSPNTSPVNKRRIRYFYEKLLDGLDELNFDNLIIASNYKVLEKQLLRLERLKPYIEHVFLA